ncbi:MAG: phosphoribosylanthranilate isomerase [Candidatus Margulisbacteria bacterium]|nr:phosphoribosylanthranilate isomerase [Candidatus Margulisiibacteriota bacterium]
MMKIKICGITNKDDALNAVSLGVDAIGFIFYDKSPRYISPEQAEEISVFLPPFVSIVGVFVDQEKEYIDDVIKRCKLDIVQLHGLESPKFCLSMRRRVIKAISIDDPSDLEQASQYQGMISALLLDTKAESIQGGTGKTFDWGLALKAKEYHIPLILAGGVTAENMKKAVHMVNPYAIDMCSGTEKSPGQKDYNKMQEVIELAKFL